MNYKDLINKFQVVWKVYLEYDVRMQSSWEPVHQWYGKLVGDVGHYYHREVILPSLLSRLKLDQSCSVLDVACGQGVFARQIPKNVPYTGVDISASLIQEAKKQDKNPLHHYCIHDACAPFKLNAPAFTHALILLALQNFPNPLEALKNCAAHLAPQGKLTIVLNHPCFRIPRQSSWGIDEPKKLQYRRMDRYLTPLNIPIEAHPGKKQQGEKTISYHYPLSEISSWLKKAGFYIEEMQELISNKASSGAKAKMENRAREEFPLFLTLYCVKK